MKCGETKRELNLFEMKIIDYDQKQFGLWLDFRSTDDNTLHGTGRRIENASEGITLAITKTAGKGGSLICLFMDAQINISNCEFVNIVY